MKTILLLPFLFLITVCSGQNDSNDRSSISDDQEFTWSFINFNEISYEYSFEVDSESVFNNGSEFMKAVSSDSGELVVITKSEELADVIVKNVQNETTFYDKEGGVEQSMTATSPNETVSDLMRKGTFKSPNQNFIYDIIFSLPSETISVGESSKVSMSFPFNANGTNLVCKGENVFKFEELTEYEGEKCAKLTAVTDISDLGLDGIEKEKYVCSVSAKATYYFDFENGNLLGCEISFENNIHINTRTNLDSVSGMEAVSKEVGEVHLKFIQKN